MKMLDTFRNTDANCSLAHLLSFLLLDPAALGLIPSASKQFSYKILILLRFINTTAGQRKRGQE